jgi:hypothetical protein
MPPALPHVLLCACLSAESSPFLPAACLCRLLDRWVVLGGARDIAEMFVPSMGVLGRWAAGWTVGWKPHNGMLLVRRLPVPLPLPGQAASQAHMHKRFTLSHARTRSEAHPAAVSACCRVRRHRAAVTLCSLLYADTCPAMRSPDRAAQALVLGACVGIGNRASVRKCVCVWLSVCVWCGMQADDTNLREAL